MDDKHANQFPIDQNSGRPTGSPGRVSLDRIRFRPSPGTAKLQDVIDIQSQEGKLCELVEGVLLEKAAGYNKSSLAIFLAGLLNAFVIPRNLGIVSGPDGTVELMGSVVRISDVAFTNWDRLPWPPPPRGSNSASRSQPRC